MSLNVPAAPPATPRYAAPSATSAPTEATAPEYKRTESWAPLNHAL